MRRHERKTSHHSCLVLRRFLLLVYGFLILVSGLAEWSHPPNTVLAELHAPVRWGTLLLVLGMIYCFKYSPDRKV